MGLAVKKQVLIRDNENTIDKLNRELTSIFNKPYKKLAKKK